MILSVVRPNSVARFVHVQVSHWNAATVGNNSYQLLGKVAQIIVLLEESDTRLVSVCRDSLDTCFVAGALELEDGLFLALRPSECLALLNRENVSTLES